MFWKTILLLLGGPLAWFWALATAAKEEDRARRIAAGRALGQSEEEIAWELVNEGLTI